MEANHLACCVCTCRILPSPVCNYTGQHPPCHAKQSVVCHFQVQDQTLEVVWRSHLSIKYINSPNKPTSAFIIFWLKEKCFGDFTKFRQWTLSLCQSCRKHTPAQASTIVRLYGVHWNNNAVNSVLWRPAAAIQSVYTTTIEHHYTATVIHHCFLKMNGPVFTAVTCKQLLWLHILDKYVC